MNGWIESNSGCLSEEIFLFLVLVAEKTQTENILIIIIVLSYRWCGLVGLGWIGLNCSVWVLREILFLFCWMTW